MTQPGEGRRKKNAERPAMAPDSTPEPYLGPVPPTAEVFPQGGLATIELPRWACIALVARCARRLQPAVESLTGGDVAETAEFERAAALCEDSARAGRPSSELPKSPVVLAKSDAGVDPGRLSPRGAAVLGARLAAAASGAIEVWRARDLATAAVSAFIRGGASAAYDVSMPLATNARNDIARLRTLAAQERWANDTPVDPDRLGPLWLQGEPIAQSESAESVSTPGATQRTGKRIVVRVAIPEDATDEEAAAIIRKLGIAISERHRQLGGSGLKLETHHSESDVEIKTPVGNGGGR